MKKAFTILFTVSLVIISSIFSVHAANGDRLQPIYSTDILTYMDGIPIQGYAVDGKTMICLEDLSDYGFSVYYNDEARALFVNKQGKAKADFCPVIERGTVGNIMGYTYETDIRAYVNGSEINAENIGGRLAVCAEELADFDVSESVRNFRFTYPSYFLRYTYDNAARTLYLFSNETVDKLYENNLAAFDDSIRISDGLFTIEDEFANDAYTQYVIKGIYRDMANYDGCDAVRFYKSGRVVNVEAALYEYEFIASLLKDGISVTEMSFSADGRYLCFSGERSKAQKYSLMGSRNVFESGQYMIDLDTFALIKVNVSEYELPMEPEQPAIWP